MKKGKNTKKQAKVTIADKDEAEEQKEIRPEDLGPDPWIEDLASKQVNDESWSCYVCLMVGLTPQVSVLSQLVQAFTEEEGWPKRSNVRAISLLDVVNLVKTRCSKSKKVCPLSVLCDKIKETVGVNFDWPVPGDLLAPLLKYMLLEWRETAIQWKTDEESSEEAFEKLRVSLIKEKPTEIPVETKDKKGAKGAKSAKVPKTEKAPKTAKAVKEQVPPPPTPPPTQKVDTYLRRRGKPLKYRIPIEDSPVGGPDFYFFLYVFYDPDLTWHMLKFGLPLMGILQFQSEEWSTPTIKALADFSKYGFYFNRRKPMLADEEWECWEVLQSEFWSKTLKLVSAPETYMEYKDVLVGKFVPPFHLLLLNSMGETAVEFRHRLYEDICTSLYNIYEIRRFYNDYLSEVKVIHMMEDRRPDMHHYNKVLDALPPYVVTVPFILDAIISQVCITLRASDIGYRLKDYNVDQMDKSSKFIGSEPENLATKLLSLHEEHDIFVEDKKCELPEINQPNLMEERDELMLKTAYAGEAGRLCKERTEAILRTFWEAHDWRVAARLLYDSRAASQYKSHIDLLATCLPGESGPQVTKLLLQLAGCPQTETCTPYNPSKFNLCTGSQKLSSSNGEYVSYFNTLGCKSYTDSQSETLPLPEKALRIVAKLNFHEELTPTMMLQALFDSCTSCNSLESAYFPLVDGSVVKFEEKSRTEDWEVKIPTLISFRDFFNYTMGDECGWLASKINCREPEQFSVWNMDSVFKDANDPIIIPIRVTEDCSITYKDFLPKSSKKHEEYERTGNMTFRLGIDLNSETEKCIREEDEKRAVKKNEVKIECYDIGVVRRTQFHGSERDLCLGHNCRLKLRFFRPLYEIPNVNMLCYIGENYLRYSSPMTLSTKRAQVYVTHKSGIITGLTESHVSISHEYDCCYNQECSSRVYYPSVSWPSGLFINMVRGSSSYFRQTYLNGVPDISGLYPELYRCILDDGTVIKFKENKEVDIYRPNGMILEFRGGCDYWSMTQDQFTACDIEGESSIPPTCYYVTTPDGKTIVIFGSREILLGDGDAEDHFDVFTETITTERSDGTLLEHATDGMLAVHFADGTRIVSKAEFTGEEVSCEWTEDELIELDNAVNQRLQKEAEEKMWNDKNPPALSQNKLLIDVVNEMLNCEATKIPVNTVSSNEILLTAPPTPRTNADLRNMPPLEAKSDKANENRTNDLVDKVRTSNITASAKTIWSQVHNFSGIRESSFVIVVIKILSVDHPYYAKISYDIDTEYGAIEMPFEVRLELRQWNVTRVIFGTEATLDVREDGRIITFGGPGLEFSIDVHKYREFNCNELVPNQVLLVANDEDGNAVEVDTLGEVSFRGDWPIGEDESRSRFFVVSENFSGTEHYPESRIFSYIKEIENTEGTVVQKYDNESFSEYVCFRPLEPREKLWTMPIEPRLGRPRGLPSTYGNSCLFPFKETSSGASTVPDMVVFRHARMARYSRSEFKNFAGAFDQYEEKLHKGLLGVLEVNEPAKDSLTENLRRLSQDKDPLLLEDFYKRGSLYEKSPSDDIMGEMKRVIVHTAKLAVREEEKDRVEQEFKFHRKALVSGKVPPYFETSDGLTLLLKNELLKKLDDNIKCVDQIKEVERLLEVPFDGMTDEQFAKLVSLLKSTPNSYSDYVNSKKNYLSAILEAGRELKAYFPNMKSVLEYHVNHSCVC